MESKWQTCIIGYVEMTKAQLISVQVVNTLIGITNVAINGFLINALRSLKQLGSPSYRFIAYLSASDLCLGLIQLAVQGVPYIKHELRRQISDVAFQFVLYFFNPFSAFMIMLIALDRYWHMKYLTRYSSMMTKRRSTIMISINVAISLTTTTILAFSSLFGFYFVFQIVLTSLFLLMILTTFVLYLTTYRSIRCRIRNLSTNRVSRNSNADRGFAKGMMCVFVSLVVCYVPHHALQMARAFMNHAGNVPTSSFLYVMLWSIIISYMNGTLNAIALILCNRKLRRYSMRFLHLVNTEQTSSGTSDTT